MRFLTTILIHFNLDPGADWPLTGSVRNLHLPEAPTIFRTRVQQDGNPWMQNCNLWFCTAARPMRFWTANSIFRMVYYTWPKWIESYEEEECVRPAFWSIARRISVLTILSGNTLLSWDIPVIGIYLRHLTACITLFWSWIDYVNNCIIFHSFDFGNDSVRSYIAQVLNSMNGIGEKIVNKRQSAYLSSAWNIRLSFVREIVNGNRIEGLDEKYKQRIWDTRKDKTPWGKCQSYRKGHKSQFQPCSRHYNDCS